MTLEDLEKRVKILEEKINEKWPTYDNKHGIDVFEGMRGIKLDFEKATEEISRKLHWIDLKMKEKTDIEIKSKGGEDESSDYTF